MPDNDMKLPGTLASPVRLNGHLTNTTLQGLSAYEVAVANGFNGTEAEWLSSLKGETGETPDIQVGTVQTGRPGTNASATIVGTKENPILNITIPRGDVGATPNVTIGTVVTGEEGSNAGATIAGTPENPILNLTIPKGNTGNDGFNPVVEVTKSGDTATITVTDSTHTTEVNIVDGYTPQKNVDYFDGHTPVITGAKSQGTTFIYSDGEQIGAIADGQDGYTPRKGVDYFDGHTPAISGEKIDDTTFIYADGVRIATVLDGLDGNSPVITTVKSGKTTSILADSVVIGTVSDGTDGHSPTITTTKSGKTTTILSDGTSIGFVTDGQDGHSPEITTNKVGKVLTILSDGQTIGIVSDGVDGEDAVTPVITTNKSGTTTTIYSNGVAIGTVEDGVDGSSPVITATKSEGITTIKANGVDIATINDGISGEDGYSPTASVTKSGGVSTLTVTDESGTTTTQILDGTGMTASDPNNDGNIVLSSVVGVQIDEEPTSGSTNAISSGSVYNELTSIKGRLNDELTDIRNDLNKMQTATSEDVGKSLKAKTVESGKVTEWEFGETGSPTDATLSATSENPVQNKAIANMFGNIPALSEYGSNVYEILEYLIDAVENPIDPNAVDVCLFAGQSNMDGRGTVSEATPVTTGKAYKWDSSTNTTVAFETEGSLIPAYMQEYTKRSKVPLVEVKVAEGGVTIDTYINNYLPTAKTRLEACLVYLRNSGKTVRRVFMLWNQGESDVDGDGSTGTAAYEASFATLKSGVIASGVEQIFIINIGQASNGTFDFSPIRTALQEVCNGTDVVMVSDKFYNATTYMKDRWHYNQIVYNAVGKDAATNTIYFYKTGNEPVLIPFNAADVYGVPDEYGTLEDWNYELYREMVILKGYVGTNPDVYVYNMYKSGDMYYRAVVKRASTGTDTACFQGNSVIEQVIFDDTVRFANGYNIGDNVQGLESMFRSATNLVSVVINNGSLTFSAGNAFRDASKFESFNFLSQIAGNMTYAFANTKIRSLGDITSAAVITYMCQNAKALEVVGDISGTYTSAQAAFMNCTALKTVGVIGSTTLTSINSIFVNCSALEGTVRFESKRISAANNAFYGVDFTKVTIECPADSTTYTTLSAAYPSANIVTFEAA